MQLVDIKEKTLKTNAGAKIVDRVLLVEMSEEEFVELKSYLMKKEEAKGEVK